MPPKQVIVDIPTSHIVDTDTVIKEIRESHEFQPDERAEALAAFVLGQETDFGLTLGELTESAAKKAIATSQDETARVSLFSTKKPREDSIQLTVDGETGKVTEAGVVRRIPEDKKATSRNKSMSKRVPSGPVKNDSSFRTSVVDPRRRR